MDNSLRHALDMISSFHLELTRNRTLPFL